MKLSQLRLVVEILCQHGETEHEEVCAEHDELFLPGPPPERLRKWESDRLQEANARWQQERDCWAVFT